MAEKAVPMTKDGIQRLEKELDHLRNVRRHEVADRIHEAKELASAQNNSEYEEAKNEQAFVEGRIMTLEHLLQNATRHRRRGRPPRQRRPDRLHGHATASDGKKMEYTIVGAAEAQPDARA